MENTSSTAKSRVHFVAPYLMRPLHEIKVTLIGAGGSGSQMLSSLARINSALIALGRKGLHVTVYDPDIVEKPNIGRQLFAPSELGLNKAVALVSRINRFYGLGWDAKPCCFGTDDSHSLGNIVITCVDNVSARLTVGKLFRVQSRTTVEENRAHYWLDLGNAQRCGQAVLGSAKVKQLQSKRFISVEELPLPDEVLDLAHVDEGESGPSCSMAEALRKQDLFVNSALVQPASSLLWSLLSESAIENRGFYINLERMMMSPIKV